MKRLLALVMGIAISGSAWAADGAHGVLKCKFGSQYLHLSKVVEYDLASSEVLSAEVKDGKFEVFVSLTECEDETQLTFDAKEWAKLTSGKVGMITGQLKHDEPDFEATASIDCTYTK